MNNKVIFALSSLFTFSASADVFISEYVEGSSFNKAIELYNPTDQVVDLTSYKLKLYTNGDATARYSIDLSGMLASHTTYVIAHQDISTKDNVDLLTTSLNFNGDDAVVLESSGEVIDSIGQIGVDPGDEWGTGLISTRDNSITRQLSITSGDTDPNNVFSPAEQWLGHDKNTLNFLGEHSSTQTDEGSQEETPDPLDKCDETYTTISKIQGKDTESPLVGQSVWVEGVVTADYQDSGYKGFYIQSTEADADADHLTSEGIFVFDDKVEAEEGDRVRFKAEVAEYYELSQLKNVVYFSVCSSDNVLPSAIELSLPLDGDITDLESVEGMRVNFPQPLFVTDTYNYGRYGQLGLASERLFNPTQVATPGEAAQAVKLLNQSKSIVLDDGDTNQNPEILPYPGPELTANNTVRSGDSAADITAVVSYSFGQYLLLPTQPIDFEKSNARTQAPEIITEGDVRIASFNVLNYFNGDGLGGGFPTARGADTAEEFERQRMKIINAINALDADIIGLMEIENDGYSESSAIVDLINGLNEEHGETVFAFVAPEVDTIGTDDIAVGLIYRKDKVSVDGDAKILDSSNSLVDAANNPLFLESKNRPMLTQGFTDLASNKSLVVAVNHLKSKGSDCDELGDPDLNDGQARCNKTRTNAAVAISDFLNKNYQDQAILIIGDLNAYAKEDPIIALDTAGYKDIFNHLEKEAVYSYIYSGEMGQLDHALANETLMPYIVDIATWAINADEPKSLDYNTEYQSTEQQSRYYAPDAYRSSDHDPVVVELQFAELTVPEVPATPTPEVTVTPAPTVTITPSPQVTPTPQMTEAPEDNSSVTDDKSGGAVFGVFTLLLGLFAVRKRPLKKAD